MLQIVTGMYFRDEVERHKTVQRQVLYTNCSFLREAAVELPVGRILPSTGHALVSAVTVEVIEQLEALLPDGSRSVLRATTGLDLIDDLAVVLSFGLNATFSRSLDLVERLVQRTTTGPLMAGSEASFRRTFEPALFVSDDDIADLRRFISKLVALRRPHFESAMRAMRRFVRETRAAAENPTEAYAGLVAALESLSEGVEPLAQQWNRLDSRKRNLLDTALKGVEEPEAERVRLAILEAERAGATQRFVSFILDSIDGSFFRDGAVGATAPIRRPDLERLARQAYAIRSGNVHALDDLPPEAWIHGMAETVSPHGVGPMLSLEGLGRLGRATIRSYVETAPTGVEPGFDWRSSLSGFVRVELAPQYWIERADSYDASSAPTRLSAFLRQLVDGEGVSDMSAVAEKIEALLPQTSQQRKEPMIALYALWDRVAAPDRRRPQAAEVLAQHGRVLRSPTLLSFVVETFRGSIPKWDPEAWFGVAEDRWKARQRRRHLDLPAGLDAALHACAAESLMEAGRLDDARLSAGRAVEEMPGCSPLVAWEAALIADAPRSLDLPRDLFGIDASREAGDVSDG